MPVEVIGNQLRIRVRSPSHFIQDSFRTQELGADGLQRIAGQLKRSGEWQTQAYHLNLANSSPQQVFQTIDNLHGVSNTHKKEAKIKARLYFMRGSS